MVTYSPGKNGLRAVLAVLFLICCGPPSAVPKPVPSGVPLETARRQKSLSFVTLNIRNAYNYPFAERIGWKERFDRLVDWMRRGEKFPDIIALQEFPIWWYCPTNPKVVGHYEPMARLLRAIENAGGPKYRIGYAMARVVWGEPAFGLHEGASTAGACQGRSGNALLFDPDRIETVAPEGMDYPSESGYADVRVRRSLVCN